MNTQRKSWRALIGSLAAFTAFALPQASAHAASWSPEKNVEIIVTTGPGGAQDRTARVMQRILQKGQYTPVPITVLNKPGGGGAIGLAYLNLHPGDGQYLLTTSPTILANHILGKSKVTYTDVTPVAQLFSEYVGFAVSADSPIKNAKDLVHRLQKDPSAYTAAIATSAGNHNHVAIGMVMKTAGVDLKRLRIVIFKSSGEAVTNLLGGHVNFIATTASNLVRLSKGGKLRVIALAAPERLPGPMAAVPTWRELGIDAIGNNWRGIALPKGATAEEVHYWEDVFAKMVASDEWKQEMKKNLWVGNFMRSGASKQEYKRQYAELKAVLTELGLAK